MFFSAITNWQILTKNLVTFKRSDGVMDEKFMGNSPKNPISVWGGGREGGRVLEKSLYSGNCLER